MNTERLAAFLDGGNVEVAPGGTAILPFFRRHVFALLMAFGLAVAPAAFAEEAPQRGEKLASLPRIASEFQRRIDALGMQDRIVIVMENEEAASSAATIHFRFHQAFTRHGLAFSPMPRVIDIKKKVAQQHPVGVNNVNLVRYPDGTLLPIRTILLTRHTFADASATTQYLLQYPERPACENPGVTIAAIHRAFAVHETFGHGTFGILHLNPDEMADEFYRRGMDEFRADLASLIFAAHEEGNTSIGRFVARHRIAGRFCKVKAAYGRLAARAPGELFAAIDHPAPDFEERFLAPTEIYNNGENLLKAADEIDATLADPRKNQDFRRMDDKALLALTDEMFHMLRPTPDAFRKQNRTLRAAAAFEAGRKKVREGRGNLDIGPHIRREPALALNVRRFLGFVDASEDALLEPRAKWGPRRPSTHRQHFSLPTFHL